MGNIVILSILCTHYGLFPQRTIYIPLPTWGNHTKVFNLAGLSVKTYRYYDPATRGLNFQGLELSSAYILMTSNKYIYACVHIYVCIYVVIHFSLCACVSYSYICLVNNRLVGRPWFCSIRSNCASSCMCP